MYSALFLVSGNSAIYAQYISTIQASSITLYVIGCMKPNYQYVQKYIAGKMDYLSYILDGYMQIANDMILIQYTLILMEENCGCDKIQDMKQALA